ncbi:MAG: hypothetical protein MUD01_05615, partial [Chloroflexaceae bacterium]|nr:hypothetical protein [Chloroflexaceae bacterium]
MQDLSWRKRTPTNGLLIDVGQQAGGWASLHALLQGSAVGCASLGLKCCGRQPPLHAPAAALRPIVAKQSYEIVPMVRGERGEGEGKRGWRHSTVPTIERSTQWLLYYCSFGYYCP